MSTSFSFIEEVYQHQIFLTFITRNLIGCSYSRSNLIGVKYIHLSLTDWLTDWLIHWPVHNLLDAPTKRYFFTKKKKTQKAISCRGARFSQGLGTKMYNVVTWSIQTGQNLDFIILFYFCFAWWFQFFSWPFLFFFRALLTLASFCFSYPFWQP